MNLIKNLNGIVNFSAANWAKRASVRASPLPSTRLLMRKDLNAGTAKTAVATWKDCVSLRKLHANNAESFDIQPQCVTGLHAMPFMILPI